jgi:hypothetical protein
MRKLFLIPVCALAVLTSFQTLRADENDNGIQVQARGPVHEAFAQLYQKDPTPSVAVDKKPPDPIPEEPAEEKPVGDNVQWIPGYWQWDVDRNDYIWISGTWRNMPAGRRWVTGYWADTPEGYRWVSGHFADAQEVDYQYVPEPPANPDEGPISAAPDDTSIYIPGSWQYGDSGYTYRTGYWTDCYDDRVWMPAYYSWSPYGYRYCSGYWDYPFARRGLLFAPVYFNRPYWYTSGWYYRPRFTIGFDGLFGNLFVSFGYNHYFFGDYYARSYLNSGIYPWFWRSRYHYDPIWAHQRWSHRNNPNWATSFRSNYVARVNGTAPLPPRTLAAQASLAASGRLTAGTPRMVNSFSEARQAGLKLETVSRQQKTAQLQAAQKMVAQAKNLSQAAPRVSPTVRVQSSNRTTTNLSPRVNMPNVPRTNVPRTPNPGAPRTTAPSVPRMTTPNVPRTNTPSVPRTITPSVPRMTTPNVPRTHTPSVPRMTSPSQPRTVTPSVPRMTTPSIPRITTPSVPRITTAPSQPRTVTQPAPRPSQSMPRPAVPNRPVPQSSAGSHGGGQATTHGGHSNSHGGGHNR